MNKMEEVKHEYDDSERKILSHQFEHFDIKKEEEDESIDHVSSSMKFQSQDMGEDVILTRVKYEDNVCEHYFKTQNVTDCAINPGRDTKLWCHKCNHFLNNVSESLENKYTLKKNILRRNCNECDDRKVCIENCLEINFNIQKSDDEEKHKSDCKFQNLQSTSKLESNRPTLNDDIELWCRKCNILFCNPSESEEHGCELWCRKCNILFCSPSESEEHCCELWCGKCNILFCSSSESEEHVCAPESPQIPSPVNCSEQLAVEANGEELEENSCDHRNVPFSTNDKLDLHAVAHSNNNNDTDPLAFEDENCDESIELWCENCNILFCSPSESEEHDCATYNLGLLSADCEKQVGMETDTVDPDNDFVPFDICSVLIKNELDTHDLAFDEIKSLGDESESTSNTSVSDKDEDSNLKSCKTAITDNLVCNQCNATMPSLNELYIHMEAHKQFTCDICKKSYNYKCNLVTHMTSHTRDRPFRCKICDKTYSYNSNLVVHMRTHTGERPYRCKICNKSFSVSQTLSHHMLIHSGDKPFQCETCRNLFATKKVLMKHMKTHTGERPFRCEICNKFFARKASLRGHTRIHTGERPFSCSVCKRTFPYGSCLRSHMRTHTGYRPFQCVVCGKSFSQKNTLNYHMYAHTEERPFSCATCNKAFHCQRDLQKHAFTHTDERPFSCNVCNKTFRRKHSLAQHMLHIHNGKDTVPKNEMA